MLTSASKYAIRSVLYLALNSDETKKIRVKKIAEELEAPRPFLAKLLQQLNRNELVSSTKGPNGGFFLNEKNRENSVWNVISNIGGTEKFDQCFLGLSECSDQNPCPVHYKVSRFKQGILVDFKDKTILQWAKEINNSKKVLSLKNFDIPIK